MTGVPITHAKARRGTYVKPTSLTLADYLDTWLSSLHIRASTRAGYRTKIERHVKPAIGNKRVDGITRATLEELYRRLVAGGAPIIGRVKDSQ